MTTNAANSPEDRQNTQIFNHAICRAFIQAYVELQSSPNINSNHQHHQTSNSVSSSSTPYPNTHLVEESFTQTDLGLSIVPSIILDDRYFAAIDRIYQDILQHHQQSLVTLKDLLNPNANSNPIVPDSHVAFTYSYAAYERVIHKVFEKQISWGRIIMMLIFTGMIAVKSLTLPDGSVDRNAGRQDYYSTEYANWAVFYIERHLQAWIDENGGWEGLLSYESNHPGSQILSDITGSLFVAGGLLLLGGIAAYLFTRGPH